MQRSPAAIVKVIESCLDDERALVQGSRLVDHEKAAVLTRLAEERRQFSEELERLNGPSRRGQQGSWGGLAREIGNDIAAAVSGSRRDVIASCLRSQRRTDERYEKALELEWPSELMAVLVAQHERVQHAAVELAELEQ